MDVVNLSRSRRFLRERPMHVTLFDRPRLVCDLLCLEGGQTETRRGFDSSDMLFVVIEGAARIRTGAQSEELQEMDAVLIPPGVDTTVENTGDGQLVVLVTVTPKPRG
jgi:mannose-6-phosphate isomerase-like protein (cupin superfamily)